MDMETFQLAEQITNGGMDTMHLFPIAFIYVFIITEIISHVVLIFERYPSALQELLSNLDEGLIRELSNDQATTLRVNIQELSNYLDPTLDQLRNLIQGCEPELRSLYLLDDISKSRLLLSESLKSLEMVSTVLEDLTDTICIAGNSANVVVNLLLTVRKIVRLTLFLEVAWASWI